MSRYLFIWMTPYRWSVPASCLLGLFFFNVAANVLSGQAYRAGYRYAFGTAYSASVDLPRYQIVDLGPSITPLAINDRASILVRDTENHLLLWKCGESIQVWDRHLDGWPAFLNEKDKVIAYYRNSMEEIQILSWQPGYSRPQIIPWNDSLLSEPLSSQFYSFNDQDELILRVESQSGGFPLPPAVTRLDTMRLFVQGTSWELLHQYAWTINMDFSLDQGGELHSVVDTNNLGDTIGEYYADSAHTPPMGLDPQYAFQTAYDAYNARIQLGFEPLQINDARTILGQSPGPLPGLIILDSFGQRPVGPVISALSNIHPQMSNPDNGLEEIIIGNTYLKRMTERNFFGQPTGQPSPDFWTGKLDTIIESTSGWKDLEATCISANGRIAGSGFRLNPDTLTWDRHAFLLLPGALVPDWDRSGSIEDTDRQLASGDEPWRYWINDDNDSGDLALSSADDLPSSSSPDWDNANVDGLRDVVDFFPLLVDLQPLLQSIPDPRSIEVTLQQEDAALNMVYTNLHPSEVGRIRLQGFDSGFGPDFTLPPGQAPVHQIDQDPLFLNARFLDNIRAGNRGVLLLEGRRSSSKPLVLNILRDGLTVLSCSLPLSISPVRDMFRIINLRNADPKFSTADPGPWGTRSGDPPNLPDSFFSPIIQPMRTLVHIHGFNWGGDEIPAAHAELFKRFFQSGSNARFIGITWFGDQGTLELTGSTFDYNENVANALITAKYLAEALAPFSGQGTSLFAHSLGNMVASSSIVDHGLQVGPYFMINAAVPNESYLGEQDDRRLMVHPDWKNQSGLVPDYAEYLLAANWFQLFPVEDRRSDLKWKERFNSISNHSVCLNFYSSAEDILAPGNGPVPPLFEAVWKSEQVWTYNEMLKGTVTLATSLAGDIQGGWGFNVHYMDWVNPGGAAHPPSGYWEPMSPTAAGLIPPASFIPHPFFDVFSTGDSDYPLWSDGDWLYEDMDTANAHLPAGPLDPAATDRLKNHAKILVEAIPAHSAPAGSTPLPNLPLLGNIDMDRQYRDISHWPLRDKPLKRDRWLHSDYLYPSLSHVGELYQKCIEYINIMP